MKRLSSLAIAVAILGLGQSSSTPSQTDGEPKAPPEQIVNVNEGAEQTKEEWRHTWWAKDMPEHLIPEKINGSIMR